MLNHKELSELSFFNKILVNISIVAYKLIKVSI